MPAGPARGVRGRRIPPVLHMGSCVDNSRILSVCAAIVAEGGLGTEIAELPVAAAAPRP